MGAVLTIASRDLKSFFTSIRGWSILWMFLILMGFFFQSFIASFMEMQQQAAMMRGEAPTLEQLLKALFYNLHFILILVIPAVTMASFSEEKRNQSIRLLQTAPVSAAQIVFGKFLASFGMMGLVLVCSSIYPLFTMAYGNPDSGVILSAYLGLFLLIGAQLSFGLWVSSMTSNQFVSFLFTMLGLFMLLILNWIAPSITDGGLMETVVKYIASMDHLDNFFRGMITVGDLAYFFCFIALFLFFTNIVLDTQRWR